MAAIAWRMLCHNKRRFMLTALGMATAFFLTVVQSGLLVGWVNTTSAIIRHAGVDVWVMAQQTPAFDYGTAIPRTRIYQVRSVPGVEWAEAMFMAWNTWQRPDGRRINIELIGLDDACVGGPWKMVAGDSEIVHLPDTVIVDELFLAELGVERVGDEIELYGQRAIVGGVSQEVRTFTASPFVFTSIKSAINYDRRYAADEITYVLVRCDPGHSPESVRDAIRVEVPAVQVMTTSEFALTTVSYWMLETGIGITVVLTALLGIAIGAVVISQTLFAITQEHSAEYATLLAIGFHRWQLARIVFWQSLTLGCLGIVLGTSVFWLAAQASARTPIPLETTPAVYAGLVLVCLATCAISSLVSVRTVLNVDPVLVFRH